MSFTFQQSAGWQASFEIKRHRAGFGRTPMFGEGEWNDFLFRAETATRHRT